jgi:hypothetical protein
MKKSERKKVKAASSAFKILLCALFLIFVFLFSGSAFARDAVLKGVSAAALTSLSVENTLGLNNLQLTIEARPAANSEPFIDVKKAARKSLEYFFIGLVLSDNQFWANLSPESPNGIIEPVLAQTDLGRIMLATDLKLKKDVCELTNPKESKVGKEFWTRLYRKAAQLGIEDNIPAINRVWIVPKETIVSETENRFTILKNSLGVCLESEYFSQTAEAKDGKLRELQDYASGLMKELIIPVLEKKVNESYSYAALKEIYNALVLARWYKNKFGFRYNSLLHTMGKSEIIEDAEVNFSYGPEMAYQDYIKSYKSGEYSFSESYQSGMGSYTTVSYFSGGIDFRKTKLSQAAANIDEQKNKFRFSFNISIPQGFKRPLHYAKQQLDSMRDELIQQKDSRQEVNLAFTDGLPEIVAAPSFKQRIEALESIRLVERIAISKL